MGGGARLPAMSLNSAFPHLADEGYVETSPATRRYNCIAWAAGHSDAWWWPSPLAVHYWPEEAPREETLEAFLRMFATLGFAHAEDGHFEPGFEKVALFTRDGKPTHAARQLIDGAWTSKLGEWLDVTHTLRGLEGPLYGVVAAFLRRPVLPATTNSP
jgi:hypothetical protein